ncbi:MAG: hypothetical protein ACYDBQ_09550 [Thermoplasmatota archaeon]
MNRTMLALLAATVALQGAAAEGGSDPSPSVSTPTTLYFHVIQHDDMPINTQIPSNNWTAQDPAGLGNASSSCVPPVPGEAFTGQERHTYYGYSSPSIVQYDVLEQGKPRVHPERGLSYDALLDSTKPWVLHWYLKSQAVASNQAPAGPGSDPNRIPVVVPNVVVKATVRTGDGVSLGNQAYNSGAVLGEGKSDPITLAGPATDSVNRGKGGYESYNETSDGSQIYGFAVTIVPAASAIPKATGYNVRIDVTMDNGACNDPGGSGYLMPNLVRVYSDDVHRPRMALAVLDPIRIDIMHPQFVGDEMVVHTEMNTPWGNYDVNNRPGGVQLHIRGPGLTADPPHLHVVAFLQRQEEHNHHTQDVAVTYAWPYKVDSAADGTYRVAMSATNLQETATATETATFQIGAPAGAVHASPAASLIVPLAAALLVARRRLGGGGL